MTKQWYCPIFFLIFSLLLKDLNLLLLLVALLECRMERMNWTHCQALPLNLENFLK